MLFNKPVSEIEFPDINKLKEDQINESEVLDYKEEIDDNNVLKEVVAFSNSQGGYLIYGIQESGRAGKEIRRGSYPQFITGIDSSYKYERLEQLIISNITPRVSVQFKRILIPNSDKIILVIHIPEGQNKPYYNSRGNKYFKRYNFEATPMLEHEIESMYRERFFGVSNLSRYVNEAVSFNRNFIPFEERSKIIDCHIIISPLRIEDRIIDTTDGIKIGSELRKSMVSIPHSRYLYGIEEPSKYGIKWKNKFINNIVEVHRNGLVYSMNKCGSLDENENTLMLSDFSLGYDLLNTTLFADNVYSMFNFSGRVKIIVKIMNCGDSRLYIPEHDRIFYDELNRCDAEEITVEREWDSWKLKDDYLKIGKSVMDEVANCYGFWKSKVFFEKEGSILLAK